MQYASDGEKNGGVTQHGNSQIDGYSVIGGKASSSSTEFRLSGLDFWLSGLDSLAELRLSGLDFWLSGLDSLAELKLSGLDFRLSGLDSLAKLRLSGLFTSSFATGTGSRTGFWLSGLASPTELWLSGREFWLSGLDSFALVTLAVRPFSLLTSSCAAIKGVEAKGSTIIDGLPSEDDEECG